MDRKDFLRILAERLVKKAKDTVEKLQILWLGKRMEFFRWLTEDTKVGLAEFSEALTALVENPMFLTSTDEDRAFIELVVMNHHRALHYKALGAYLKVTQSFSVAEFFINSVLAFEPAFEEEISHEDPRAKMVQLAFTAVETLAVECKQQFAQVVLEMFPLLPVGKKEGEGGLYGLISYAADPTPSKPMEETRAPQKGDLVAKSAPGEGVMVPRNDHRRDVKSPVKGDRQRKNEGGSTYSRGFIDLGGGTNEPIPERALGPESRLIPDTHRPNKKGAMTTMEVAFVAATTPANPGNGGHGEEATQ